MPITRGSPSYRYKWEIPALIFSLFLMFYGSMWVFGLIGDFIIDSETDWMLTLADFGVTMSVGMFLFLGSIALVGWARVPGSAICSVPESAPASTNFPSSMPSARSAVKSWA